MWGEGYFRFVSLRLKRENGLPFAENAGPIRNLYLRRRFRLFFLAMITSHSGVSFSSVSLAGGTYRTTDGGFSRQTMNGPSGVGAFVY